MNKNMHNESIELALETWVKITKILEYKIEQASLLAYSNFAIFKGFETCLDTLRVRFGSTLNPHAPLFFCRNLQMH